MYELRWLSRHSEGKIGQFSESMKGTIIKVTVIVFMEKKMLQ